MPVLLAYHFGSAYVTHDKGHTFFGILRAFDWLHGAIGQDCVGMRPIRALYKGEVVFVQRANRLDGLLGSGLNDHVRLRANGFSDRVIMAESFVLFFDCLLLIVLHGRSSRWGCKCDRRSSPRLRSFVVICHSNWRKVRRAHTSDRSSSPRLRSFVVICHSNLHRVSSHMLLLARELRHLYLRHIGLDGRIPSLELLRGTFSRGLALWLRRLALGEGQHWQFVAEECSDHVSVRGHVGGEAGSSITS
mmetsp:Transcript_7552/g.13163  ORF Transcript_7552/g.13163 Transcript_7552/m.13163 type:complete len:247 (-) Transcript_7552:264-1004(-)